MEMIYASHRVAVGSLFITIKITAYQVQSAFTTILVRKDLLMSKYWEIQTLYRGAPPDYKGYSFKCVTSAPNLNCPPNGGKIK